MSHKKHIITICIILLAITTLGVFWYTQKNTNKFVQTEIQEDVQEKKEKTNNEIVYNNDEKIDTSDWQTYRNEEYGFEVKLPGDINKWDIYSESDSFKIYFSYLLDQEILRVKSQPNLGYIQKMDMYFVKMIPIQKYSEGVCQSISDSCEKDGVIARNNQYVFLSGFKSVEGAGYLCNDDYKKQKEFCDVYSVIQNISSEFSAF